MIDPVALLREYHAALNAYDLDKVERMFAENAIYNSPGLNGEIKGRGAIMQAMRTYFIEHTDQISLDEKIEQLEKHCSRARWNLRATNRAGAKISRHGEEKIYFTNNGLIEKIEVKDYL